MAEKFILSLQRGMALLEAVAGSPDGVRLQDLAGVINCSSPATLNLAKTLVALGYLKRIEKPIRYVVGDKVGELYRLQGNREEAGAVKRAMTDLGQTFPGLSIHYCVFKGSELVIQCSLEADAPGGIKEGGDYVLPAYTSLASMTHLAFWPEEIRTRYCEQHPFDVYGIAYWQSWERFDVALTHIREEGVYHKSRSSREGIGMGVPVFTPGGSIASSITLGWRPPKGERLDLDEKRMVIAEAAVKLFSSK